MVYKPNKVASGYEAVEAKVRLGKAGSRKVVQVNTEEGTYVLDAEECPKWVRPGQWMIKLSKDHKKMSAIWPIRGEAHFRVVGFPTRENKPPVPKVHPKYNYSYFSVIVELTAPKEFAGMQTVATLHYNFAPDDENPNIVAYSHPKSKYTEQLDDFMTSLGAWDKGEMKYSDNILPPLEKRLLRAGKEAGTYFKDGYMDSFFSLDQGVDDEGEPSDDLTPIEEVMPDEEEDDNSLVWEGDSE